MRGDVGLGIARFFHGNLDFVCRITLPRNGIGWASHAAVRHDLDEPRTLPQLLTAGQPHLIHSVCDTSESAKVVPPAICIVDVVAAACVSVAARFGKSLATDDKPWTFRKPLLDGFRKGIGCSA